jgi:hypothetical protein
MTKADRIRQLAAHEIFTTREIADIVAREYGSCGTSYVRVCSRQRVPGGCDHGMTWKMRNPEKQAAYVRACHQRRKNREASP